jgi:hypothetical protein
MTRHQSSDADADDRFSLNRRRLITGTPGLVTAGATLPLLNSTASARFPTGLDTTVSPDSESNELDPTSDETVTVAVLCSEFEVEHDGETETETFDPTERDQRYRFGAADAVAGGGGARPVGEGTIRDGDGDPCSNSPSLTAGSPTRRPKPASTGNEATTVRAGVRAPHR